MCSCTFRDACIWTELHCSHTEIASSDITRKNKSIKVSFWKANEDWIQVMSSHKKKRGQLQQRMHTMIHTWVHFQYRKRSLFLPFELLNTCPGRRGVRTEVCIIIPCQAKSPSLQSIWKWKAKFWKWLGKTISDIVQWTNTICSFATTHRNLFCDPHVPCHAFPVSRGNSQTLAILCLASHYVSTSPILLCCTCVWLCPIVSSI